METTKKCKDKVESAFVSRMEDIRHLVKADGGDGYYCETCKEYGHDPECWNCEKTDNVIDIEAEIGRLNEYGLSIDLVEAGTFEGQREDYIRYQISWGGPSEEFRIYKNGDVEFWYLDWFDGASIDVRGEDAETIKEIVQWIAEENGWRL